MNTMLVKPDFEFFARKYQENGGKSVAEDFEYDSKINPWRLTADELREMVKSF